MKLKLFAAALCVLVSASASAHAPYPQSRVTLVTHSSPGGGTNLFLRELSIYLTPLMETSFKIAQRKHSMKAG